MPDEAPATTIGDHSWFASVDMVDVDGLYAEYRANGVKIIQELVNRPWGTREFSIETPDGHRIMFGQEIKVS